VTTPELFEWVPLVFEVTNARKANPPPHLCFYCGQEFVVDDRLCFMVQHIETRKGDDRFRVTLQLAHTVCPEWAV